MIKHFQGETADEVWRMTADELLHGNDWVTQDSRLGQTREILHCTLHIQQPRQRWVLSRKPSINPAFAIAEIIWILQGRNDAGFLNYWNPILPKYAGQVETYHGAYGHRLRNNCGIDQIERAYNVLSANPKSRQVVLQIWDSEIDLPHDHGKESAPDIPCNIASMLKIRNGKLEWMQIMRSNDLFLGTPHNLIQFTSLQEIIAGWLEIDVGTFTLITDSLHLYEHDIDKMTIENTTPTIYNIDSLALTKDEFDRVLLKIGDIMDSLRSPNLSKERFQELIKVDELNNSWRNLLYITAADAARRRNWLDEMNTAAEHCSNPALIQAWSDWLKRTQHN